MLQISSLSFQYECSRIKLNMLKLYVHLEFCGFYFLLFFLSLLGFHNTLVGGYTSYFRTGLIIVPFLVDKSFLRVFVLRGLPYLGVWIHSKENFFSFLSWFSARHYFGIWVSFISQIMFLVFQRTNELIMRLHPLTTTW